MNTNTLNDREVISLQGNMIGKLKGMNFDERTWQITSLDVELDGKMAEEIGMKKRFGRSTLPLKPSFVGGIGEKVIVNASKDDLMNYANSIKEEAAAQETK